MTLFSRKTGIHIIAGWRSVLGPLAVGLCLLAVSPALLAAAPPVRIMPAPEPRMVSAAPDTAENLTGSAEELYAKAKRYYEQLVRNQVQPDSRRSWLVALRQFQRVRQVSQNDTLTANSLFMQGRLYRRMYDRFRVTQDLNNAIFAFQQVAAAYPNNTLADDALYYAAEASLLDPAQKKLAPELLRSILRDYADSDHAEQAARLLNRLGQPTDQRPGPSGEKTPAVLSIGQQAGGSEAPPSQLARMPTRTGPAGSAAPAPQAQQPRPAAGGQPVRVDPIKYWSSDDYTRIAIPTSAAVSYTHTLLEKQDGMPPRLVIDFAGSRLAPNNKVPVLIGDGLLKQVRTGQYTPETVRVVLDIESISDYKVFSLSDPFRVIVDVRGSKTGAPSQSPAKTASRVRPEDRPAPPAPLSRPPAPPVQTPPDMQAGETVRGIGGELVTAPEPQSSPPPVRRGKLVTSPETLDSGTLPITVGAEAGVLTEKAAPSAQEQQPPRKEQPQVKLPKGKQLSLAQQLGLGVRHIVIDPGHGGKDPGATGFGLKEKNVVLRLARIVAQKLQEEHGYKVSLTRNQDVFIPLEERTAIANTKKADLFLSLHVNANPDKRAGGVETYYLNLTDDPHAMQVAALENATSTRSLGDLHDILHNLLKNAKIDESSKLAQAIQRHLARGLKQYKIKNLGVKQAPFYVLIGAEMPAVLLEVSFITNPQEAKLLQDEAYLNKVAEEIINGLNAFVQKHHSAALQY